jgi:hypothetical protein
MFFEMFEGWSQGERKAYLKFASGWSKIPINTQDMEHKHSLTLFDYYDEDLEKNSLPRSHTCFFKVDLPDYDNIDIMRARFRTALEYCGDIDADGDPDGNEGEDDYDVEDDESDEYGEESWEDGCEEGQEEGEDNDLDDDHSSEGDGELAL